MAATLTLLREGEYIRRVTGGGDGFVDTYGVEGLVHTLSKTAILAIVQAGLDDLNVGDSKDGLPLAQIRLSKVTATETKVRVAYGRAGGNGGYFEPPSHSSLDMRPGRYQVPVCKLVNAVTQQYAFQFLTVNRPIVTVIHSERVETSFVAALRTEINTYKGGIRQFAGGGWFQLIGGRVFRARNNERRAEVVFEQHAALKEYPPQAIENETTIAALPASGEYLINRDVNPPRVVAVAPENLYSIIPPEAFAWVNFDA